jgi:hypothetical protein
VALAVGINLDYGNDFSGWSYDENYGEDSLHYGHVYAAAIGRGYSNGTFSYAAGDFDYYDKASDERRVAGDSDYYDKRVMNVGLEA